MKFHPALRHVAAGPRASWASRTTFNFLGPLTNPARVRAQAIGVADPRMAPIVAGVLAERGNSALVFRGDDGLDELTTTATSQVWVVRDGKVAEEAFDPRDVGLDLVPGGGAARRRRLVQRRGRPARCWTARPGPVRDAVLLNSAAALVALDPAGGHAGRSRSRAGMAEGRRVDRLRGAPSAALERWVAASNA